MEFKLIRLIFAGSLIYGLLLLTLQQGFRIAYVFTKSKIRFIDGERVVLRVTHSKLGYPIGLLLEFAVPSCWRFCIRAENWFDRLAKALHIVREPEIGDAEFDQSFFLEVDSPALLHLLETQHQLRHRHAALALQIAASDGRLQLIASSAGQLSVAMKLPRSMRFEHDEKVINAQLEKLAASAHQWLKPLLTTLRAQSPNSAKAEATGTRAMQIALTSAALALLLNAVTVWNNPMLDIWRLQGWMIAIAGLIWMSLLALVAWHCRRSMKRHYTLLVCSVFLIPLAGITGFHAARILNVALAQPKSAVLTAELRGISAHPERGLFGPNAYRVRFELIETHALIGNARSFYPLLGASVVDVLKTSMPANASIDTAKPFPIVSLQLYPGALGAPWLKL